MHQEAQVLLEARTKNADEPAEEEIYCICRSSDVSRFMM